jgi:Cdc6-like AAA superfamily ATPase
VFEVWREVVRGYREGGLKMGTRGVLYPVGYNFSDYYGETDVFYSVYGYEYNSLDAPRIVDHLPIDLDTQDHEIVKSVISRLSCEYILYFSGHGFHVVIPNLWGFTHRDIVNKTITNTMMEYFPECDPSVYHARALIRMPRTINSKTGYVKTAITLSNLSSQYQIVSDFPDCIEPSIPKMSATNEWILRHPAIHSLGKPIIKVQGNSHSIPSPKCIHKLLRNGPVVGQRHATVMRLASHMIHYDGYTTSFASAALKDWFSEPERNEEIERIVRDVQAKYKYGCRDSLLSAQCDPRCSYYIGKDYMGNTINMRNTLEQYQAKIAAGQYFDLNHYYNIGHKFVMLDNDLLTIVGEPAVGKSMFLVDFMIRLLKDRPELFVAWSNLDTSHPLSVRRLIQNVGHLSEEEILHASPVVMAKIDAAYEFLENRITIVEYNNLDTINAALVNPTSYGLKQKPDVWIIDDVGSLQCNLFGHERMKYLGDTLKSLPKVHNTLFICTDHVPRMDSRSGNITISSSKNALLGERSDVVLAIVKHNTKMKDGMITEGNDRINLLSVKARDGKQFNKNMLFDWEHCKFNEEEPDHE